GGQPEGAGLIARIPGNDGPALPILRPANVPRERAFLHAGTSKQHSLRLLPSGEDRHESSLLPRSLHFGRYRARAPIRPGPHTTSPANAPRAPPAPFRDQAFV